jgi:hypothetical protein
MTQLHLSSRELETLRGNNHAKSGDGFEGAQSTFRRNVRSQYPNRKCDKFRQPCAYRGLADAADAGEEDSHVAPFDESLPILVNHR